MRTLHLRKPLSELDDQEFERLRDTLRTLRLHALLQARRRNYGWHRLRLLSGWRISIRVKPGLVGYLTEAVLYGNNPLPTEEDAHALAEALEIKHFTADWLDLIWFVREAPYAGVKPRDIKREYPAELAAAAP